MPKSTDIQIGQTLGMLLAHGERNGRLLEQISRQMHDLPGNIARAMPPPPSPHAPTSSSDRLGVRDKLQLALAAVIVVLALMGKVTVHEAITWLGKPVGM